MTAISSVFQNMLRAYVCWHNFLALKITEMFKVRKVEQKYLELKRLR